MAQLRDREPRRLLFYARPEPHAARNMFDLGVIALSRALAEGAFTGGWELHGIGTVQRGRRIELGGGASLELLPRADQAAYGELLRAHDVGLSLMYTPHPSLVPLEMASAGMLTVTNTFENKDADALRAISANLIAAEPTLGGITAALLEAAAGVADVDRRIAGSATAWSRDWDTSLTRSAGRAGADGARARGREMTAGPTDAVRVSVVIPNWNGRRWLPDCLRSLAAQTRSPDEVIVVDNGSGDGSLAYLHDEHPDVRVLAQGRNTGFACAANRGIEAASGELVALINTDVVLAPDWLERMATALSARPGAASAACKMLSLGDPGVVYDAGDVLRRDGACEQRGRFGRDDGRFDAPGEVFGACAGAALYRRAPVTRDRRVRRALLRLPRGRRSRVAAAPGRLDVRVRARRLLARGRGLLRSARRRPLAVGGAQHDRARRQGVPGPVARDWSPTASSAGPGTRGASGGCMHTCGACWRPCLCSGMRCASGGSCGGRRRSLSTWRSRRHRSAARETAERRAGRYRLFGGRSFATRRNTTLRTAWFGAAWNTYSHASTFIGSARVTEDASR